MVNKRIILASNSPRRKELLAGLGIDFEVRIMEGIDESYPSSLRGEQIPMHISRAKAAAYLPTLADDEVLITADTVVMLDNQVLGKPHDASEAAAMLRMLSGRTHQVMTGVTMATTEWQHTFVSVTEVDFAPLSEAQIAYYIEHYKPFDKAGAYGIQEWIGYVGVTGLRGSYFNVMGLPVQRLYTELMSYLSNQSNEQKT